MKKVVIAVDEMEGSRSILPLFRKLIRRPEAVILVHVQRLEGNSLIIDMLGEAEMSALRDSLKGTEHKAALDRKSGKILNFFRKELESDGLSVRMMTRQGVPSEEILKVAQHESADLIITGYNGKNILQRLFTGSVSRDIEKRSPVPVLVAKHPMQWKKSIDRGSREAADWIQEDQALG